MLGNKAVLSSRGKSAKVYSCNELRVSFPSQNSSSSAQDLSTHTHVSPTNLRPPALDNRALNPSQSPKPNNFQPHLPNQLDEFLSIPLLPLQIQHHHMIPLELPFIAIIWRQWFRRVTYTLFSFAD